MDSIQQDIAAVQRIAAIPSILKVVCQATGLGFAAVARVTDDQWVACAVLDNVDFGLKAGGELEVETTLCHEVRNTRQEIVIDDAAADPIYNTHHTPRIYGLRGYISVPIVLADGSFFGTLCAIDARPAQLRTEATVEMFRLFAELIAHHLDSARLLSESRAALSVHEETAKLREQFIAVLGHDLRNPVAAISGGVHLLASRHRDEQSAMILGMMGQSVSRMAGLIDNVLDFARGRLGGGLSLKKEAGRSLDATLSEVVSEIRSSHPDQRIDLLFDLTRPVEVDHGRIAQLFSNILGNAISHGASDTPIVIRGTTDNRRLTLSVSNCGAPIAPEVMATLFQPFMRGHVGAGLGLGLYIADQIARAHGGTMHVTSTTEETRFTFVMPLD